MANNIKINSPLGNQPQQKKGSGFVNLNKILQANVGNKLGQTVAQGIGQGVGQVQQGLGQAKSQFQQEAEAKNLASVGNKQAVSDALRNLSGGQTDVSDDLVKQFGTFRAGQYAGPQELDPTKTVQLGSRAQEVQGFGQALGSGGDKTRVLQAFAGKGPYSAGQSRLDSLLLGQGPQAKQQLTEARQQSRGLVQQVGNEQDIARQIAQLKTGEAQQFGKDVRGQLGLADSGGFAETGLAPELLKAIDARAQEAQTKQQQDIAGFNQLLQKIQGGKWNSDLGNYAEDLTKYGLGYKDVRYLQGLPGRETYGADLSDPRLMQAAQAATRSSVADPGEAAKAEALAKLSGIGFDQFGIDKNAAKYDPSKPFSYDVSNLKNLIGQREGAYKQDLSPIEAERQRLTQEYNAPRRGSGNIDKAIARKQAYYDALYNLDQQQRALQDKYGLKYKLNPVKQEVKKVDPNAPAKRR
jgi:hypothetical protein